MEEKFEDFPISKEEFEAQVRLALANVLQQYRGQAKLLRPKINACLEDNFGVRSRDVNVHVPEGSDGLMIRFSHPVHGEMTFEA